MTVDTTTSRPTGRSAWRGAHLEIAQSSGPTGRLELGGDLLLLSSSWERRSVEVARARHGRYGAAAVIRFAEEGASGRRAQHDRELSSLAAAYADEVRPLERLSVSAVGGWRDALTSLVADRRLATGRPLDIVADASCLPKYYMLTLLGFCLSVGLARSIRLVYAEGRYAPADSNAALAPDHAFTEGAWRSLPVPYLEGRHSPDKKVEIIASIGFETFQARKLIRLYEAEQHYLITPHPGFSAEYGEQSEREAQALAGNLDLEDGHVVRRPAGDAAGVAETAVGLLDGGGRYGRIGLCLGTKPHALGLGIAALLRPDFTLVCRMPDRYVETETPATGTSWCYEITDLSAAAASGRAGLAHS